MFPIGELKDKNLAVEISFYLQQQGIENSILPNSQGNTFILLVVNEQDITKASLEFRKAIGASIPQEIDPNWRKISNIPMGNLTRILILICLAVFFISLSPNGMERLSIFFFSNNPTIFLAEIRRGEIWRLITPVFLHFGLLHLIFNLLWLKDLGKVLEKKRGVHFFLTTFLITAIASNLAQYLTTGPKFGGLSGVVYGLLGQLWMNGIFDSSADIKLPKFDVHMMIIWFLLCMFGLIGNIANIAHGVGLSLGMLFGIWSGLSQSKESLNFLKIAGYVLFAIMLSGLTILIEYLKLGKNLYFFAFI